MIGFTKEGYRAFISQKGNKDLGDKGMFSFSAMFFKHLASQPVNKNGKISFKIADIDDIGLPEGVRDEEAIEFVFGIMNFLLEKTFDYKGAETFDYYSAHRPVEDVGDRQLGIASTSDQELNFTAPELLMMRSDLLNLREEVLFGIIKPSKKNGFVRTGKPGRTTERKVALLALLVQTYNIEFDNLDNDAIRIRETDLRAIRQREGHEKSIGKGPT